MGEMQEVLFTTAAGDNQLACAAWDFRTGTNLMTYRGAGSSSIQQHSFCVLGAEYVLAADSLKPLLHVWPINAQEQVSAVRFVLPGKVSSLTVSPDGYYLVAGIQETLYIWHLTTGRMLNSIAKHYQPVSCLRFTDDGSHFVSAGQDGSLLVWNLTQVVGDGDDNHTPLYSFTDHGLPVTDVHVGVGGMRSYMFSVSLDRSCRVYDLSCGALLLSVVFAEGLQCVTVNAMETCVYVGSVEGNIYEFHIDSVPRTKEYHAEKDHTNKFTGHAVDTRVNCLALSLDGQTLVSGGQDEQVCIWHIPSRQLLKKMAHKGALTNLFLRLTNPAVFSPEHKQPHIFCGNLKRMMDPPEADDEQIIEIRVTEEMASDFAVDAVHERRSFSHEHSSAGGPTAAATAATGVHANDAAVEEIAKLRAEVERLQRVNKNLFDVSVKQLLKRKKVSKK